MLPNNRIVAVGSSASIIYSDNFGAYWEIIYTPDNISRDIEFNSVDFADESHGMAVGTYFSIIKTDDGGISWTAISPESNHPYHIYNDVCLLDPANCFVAGERGAIKVSLRLLMEMIRFSTGTEEMIRVMRCLPEFISSALITLLTER